MAGGERTSLGALVLASWLLAEAWSFGTACHNKKDAHKRWIGAQATVANVETSQLAQLAKMTTLSIDSGDLKVIEQWAATGYITDATTNPLFVAQAGTSGDAKYEAIVDKALSYAKAHASGEEIVSLAMDRLAVELGLEIVKLVPGYVSTEVDIRASFDITQTVSRARRIIAMYEAEGIDRSRILVKVAGTYEGIKAAEILEREDGISTNITLIFGFVQAVLAAQAGARLISPFPGRILDWHKQQFGLGICEPASDPGVVCVKRIYSYYKKYGHDRTICMPASWRPSRGNDQPGYAIDEIVALAGVDRMTIPPALLQVLVDSRDELPRQLDAGSAAIECADDIITEGQMMSESQFRLELNADLCASTKLAEGINAFIAETTKLEAAIRARL